MLKKLPKELRARDIWINGLLVPYGDLPAKCPVDQNLYKISVKNRERHLSFQNAVDNHIGDDRLGVGVVFQCSKAFQLVGIDLDVPPEKTALLKLARGICQESGSYYERSLNGGYHILGTLDTAAKIGRKIKYKTPHGTLKIEVYSHGRYFLCTGKRGKKSPRGISNVQPLVDKLLQSGSAKQAENQGTADSSRSAGTPIPQKSAPMSDDDVLAQISKSRQKLQFLTLHQDGDLSEHNEDHSAGVMAWHSMIAFYTQEFKQVTRLFRRSALNRGKWKHEPNRKGGKWKRIGPGQHERIVAGLKRTFGTDPRSAQSSLEDNKYVILLKELGEVRRDLFTGDLFVQHERTWKNAFGNHIENHMRHKCQSLGSKEWKVTEIIPAFTAYMHSKQPQLLIDVPEWDGRDRIAEMCSKLNAADPRITSQIIEELVKMTLGQCWTKLYDPSTQPRMLVLQGEQGIGKDLWLEALLAGFGQYRSSLTVGRHSTEKDYAETLIRSAVIVVSEFDKVKSIGHGTLKDMITKEFFDFRPSYGKVSQRYFCRCTWFGACNPDQILTEAGANRRFIPIMLAGGPGVAIKWDYERSPEYSAQILAQMKHLAEIVFTASQKAEYVLKSINAAYAPEDATEMLLEAVDNTFIEKMREARQPFQLYRYGAIAAEMARVGRSFNIPVPEVLQLLKSSGRRYKHNLLGRFWGLPQHVNPETDENRAARRKFFKELKQQLKTDKNALVDLDEDDEI